MCSSIKVFQRTLLPREKCTRSVSLCQVHSLTHSHQSLNEKFRTQSVNVYLFSFFFFFSSFPSYCFFQITQQRQTARSTTTTIRLKCQVLKVQDSFMMQSMCTCVFTPIVKWKRHRLECSFFIHLSYIQHKRTAKRTKDESCRNYQLTIGDDGDDFSMGQGQDVGAIDRDQDLPLLHACSVCCTPCQHIHTGQFTVSLPPPHYSSLPSPSPHPQSGMLPGPSQHTKFSLYSFSPPSPLSRKTSPPPPKSAMLPPQSLST